MPPSDRYRPETIHAALGDSVYDPVAAAEFPRHILRYRNQPWAGRVGLDTLDATEWTDHFGRFQPLPGSFGTPLALRYNGHQFRHFNPDLGDGRGFLFAQLRDAADGRLLDLGTKGSGQTPWSRGADGRLTLKGGVREILASSLLEAQGVDTSKTFSLIETGEALERHDEPSPTRGAVMVRLSHSHIRIGSFQRLAALQDKPGLSRLLEHAIRHYLPEAWREEEADRATAFLEAVSRRVARTGAQWMAAGFVHGVLNTDNINVTGESFDYGPWRFLPTQDPAFTAAYFDHGGLYAYGRQPETLFWNLCRLAECLLPLAPLERLQAALDGFGPDYVASLSAAFLRRLGLRPESPERDAALVTAFRDALQASQTPFEQAIFDWQGGLASATRQRHSPAASRYATAAFDPFRAALEGFSLSDPTRLAHRYFQRAQPRTMLIDEVEALWAPIAAEDDWSRFATAMEEIVEMAEANGVAI